jgi:hypothetical protein
MPAPGAYVGADGGRARKAGERPAPARIRVSRPAGTAGGGPAHRRGP